MLGRDKSRTEVRSAGLIQAENPASVRDEQTAQPVSGAGFEKTRENKAKREAGGSGEQEGTTQELELP